MYYCDVDGTTTPHTDDAFNRIKDDWVTAVDRLHTNTETVDTWATVARVEKIQPRRLARHDRSAPRLPPKLLVLPELSTFKPTLDPLAERTFVPEEDVVLREKARRTRKHSRVIGRTADTPQLTG